MTQQLLTMCWHLTHAVNEFSVDADLLPSKSPVMFFFCLFGFFASPSQRSGQIPSIIDSNNIFFYF